MEEIYEYLIEFGFKKSDVDKIVNNYAFHRYKESTLLQKFISNNNYLLEIGYSKAQIIKMVKRFAPLYDISIENINQKINDLIEMGYSKEQIKKMTTTLPTLFGYNIVSIKNKINDLMSLGYSREEVKKITITLPSIFGQNINNIKQKIDDLILLGYSEEQVKKMTITLPTLFSLSIENIKRKIEFYREIGLDFVITDDTRQLMQSIELTFARYEYFKSNNIAIKSYRILFYSEEKQKKQFGVTNQELLLKYPYKNIEEEIKDVR